MNMNKTVTIANYIAIAVVADKSLANCDVIDVNDKYSNITVI